MNIRGLLCFILSIWLVTMTTPGFCAPDSESHSPSQSAADVLREAAGAEAAFLAAGVLNDSFQADNLASLMRYPMDELVVVNLKGSQIKQALERSVSLYPSPNDSFLQLSNIEATFSRSAPPESRIVSASLGGAKIDDARTYLVAMPSILARGGLGYFKVWDKSSIVRSVAGATLETILKGKRTQDTAPRWKVVP